MIRPTNSRFNFVDENVPERTSADGQTEKCPSRQPPEDETIEKIKKLPTGVGVILMGAGVAGLILPGPMGTPLFIAGGLVLAPKFFGKIDAYVKKRLPEFHHQGVRAVDRFIKDLEKRYP